VSLAELLAFSFLGTFLLQYRCHMAFCKSNQVGCITVYSIITTIENQKKYQE